MIFESTKKVNITFRMLLVGQINLRGPFYNISGKCCHSIR